MELQFDAVEIRILGVLIEKQITTPDYYPLTLNALVAGCNQKSNRAPVMSLAEEQVTSALARLQLKKLVRKMLLSNSRVSRYNHLFDEYFCPGIQEKVVLCELFLRGPQTAGELRTRTERMYPISSLEDVQKTLDELAAKQDGPYVVKLPRQPGQKECRYVHLFCGEPDPEQLAELAAAEKVITVVESVPLEDDRAARLEQQVADLKAEMKQLKERVKQLEDLLAELQ